MTCVLNCRFMRRNKLWIAFILCGGNPAKSSKGPTPAQLEAIIVYETKTAAEPWTPRQVCREARRLLVLLACFRLSEACCISEDDRDPRGTYHLPVVRLCLEGDERLAGEGDFPPARSRPNADSPKVRVVSVVSPLLLSRFARGAAFAVRSSRK